MNWRNGQNFKPIWGSGLRIVWGMQSVRVCACWDTCWKLGSEEKNCKNALPAWPRKVFWRFVNAHGFFLASWTMQVGWKLRKAVIHEHIVRLVPLLRWSCRCLWSCHSLRVWMLAKKDMLKANLALACLTSHQATDASASETLFLYSLPRLLSRMGVRCRLPGT